MENASRSNTITPEMTRFINATYYRGRYREKIRSVQEVQETRGRTGSERCEPGMKDISA